MISQNPDDYEVVEQRNTLRTNDPEAWKVLNYQDWYTRHKGDDGYEHVYLAKRKKQ